jgi:drug/metabolite transporter (DMT)-like permease
MIARRIVLHLLFVPVISGLVPFTSQLRYSFRPEVVLRASPVLEQEALDIELLNQTNDVPVKNIQGIASPVAVTPFDVMTTISLGENAEYRRGLITILGITFLFASNSPVLHVAFMETAPPPVVLLNAAISIVALIGLIFGGSILESSTTLSSTLEPDESSTMRAGLELGLWKFLGTTANLAGLSMTTASHGAFLIQLTTLIVPVVQGCMGVPIPRRIQVAVMLALSGVFLFTQDLNSVSASHTEASLGDSLCVIAAIFYATYDLRLFQWGKKVSPRVLITGKIATQAILSIILLCLCGYQESVEYILKNVSNSYLLIAVVLWSGIAVNAIAPFLQVGGQQAVGPTRCQTIYASQPLWASILCFCFLGETVGPQGMIGGAAFLVALYLAATAEAPDPNCGKKNCEV